MLNGKHYFVHHTPWFAEPGGELSGLIELDIEIPVSHESGGEPVDKVKLLWAIGLASIAIVVSFIANTILHEAGHLVGGLLTGYKFLSFRVGSLTLQKEDDG